MSLNRGGSLGGISQTVPGGLTGFENWDLSDHSNLGPLNLGISGLFLALVPTFIGLRIYVRFFMVRKVGWDDGTASAQCSYETCSQRLVALCIMAAVIAMAFYSMNIYGATHCMS